MPSEQISRTAEIMANRLLVKCSEKNKDYSFIDPITILMMISIMIGVIRIIQECRKNKLRKLSTNEEKLAFYKEDIKRNCRNPGLLVKRRIHKLIARNMSKQQYKVFGDSLYEVLQEVGENVTDELLSALLEYKA